MSLVNSYNLKNKIVFLCKELQEPYLSQFIKFAKRPWPCILQGLSRDRQHGFPYTSPGTQHEQQPTN